MGRSSVACKSQQSIGTWEQWGISWKDQAYTKSHTITECRYYQIIAEIIPLENVVRQCLWTTFGRIRFQLPQWHSGTVAGIVLLLQEIWVRASPRAGTPGLQSQWPLWREGQRPGPISPAATLYPPTLCINHSKDTISKSPFSISPTKYRKCKLLDSSTVL
jgi:hypothetical protein